MTLSSIFEILAVITGFMQGILIMLNKKSNWIFYIIQMSLMVIFSMINHLWGDVAMSCLFIGYGVYGLISWNREQSGSGVSLLNKNQIMITSASALILTFISYFILKQTNDPLPVLDTITTAGGLVATFLMVKHKLETWIVWFIVDILYVAQYWLLPNQALYLMGLNIIWTVMAVISFINWKAILNKA